MLPKFHAGKQQGSLLVRVCGEAHRGTDLILHIAKGAAAISAQSLTRRTLTPRSTSFKVGKQRRYLLYWFYGAEYFLDSKALSIKWI